MIDETIQFETQKLQMNNQTNSTKNKNHSEGAKLFVSAVGVPPRWAVDKLHAAGIPIMNMIGSPNHVKKVFFFFGKKGMWPHFEKITIL